jgi:predicted nucleic acid-binding protein
VKFLDTNIIIRYLTGDDQVKSDACFALFQRVVRGEETLFTSETIVAEVAYVLSSSRGPYGITHGEIRDRLLPILALRGIRFPQKSVCLRALDIYAGSPFFDFEDALAIAHMEQQRIQEIVSYDRDFDRVAGVLRVEP